MSVDLTPLDAAPGQVAVVSTVAWWQPDAPAGDVDHARFVLLPREAVLVRLGDADNGAES